MYDFINFENSSNMTLGQVRAYNEQVSVFKYPSMYGAKNKLDRAGFSYMAEQSLKALKINKTVTKL